MGCVPGDDECVVGEKPMVEVILSPFFIDEMEASNEDIIVFLNTLREGYSRYLTWVAGDYMIWSTWVNGTPILLNEDGDYEWVYKEDAYDDFHWCLIRTPESSAGGLSWHGAKLYCEWKGMQLPTEAQWEASARGQTLNEYPCGSNFPECTYGFYDCCNETDACFNGLCFECCIPFKEVSTCESPFGVKNQLGNANEWVLDWRDDFSDHSWCEDGCTDPEPTTGERPIMKGGAVYSNFKDTRISSRKVLNDATGNESTGVRCVRPDTPVNPDGGTDGGKK
jgi:formylglycine-generating enzyme required for sulfatase activity